MQNMNMKKTLLLSLFAILAAIALVGGAGFYLLKATTGIKPDLGTLHPDFSFIGSYHSVKDTTYCSPDNTPQKLDLFIPDKKDTKFPLLIYAHGGGWLSGDKAAEETLQYVPEVARAGYVVASVNYRLAPAHTFPAQVQDVKCAIRYLRANAGKYQINPERVGIIGESAGGYLAAFVGTTADAAEYKTAENRDTSDKVQAVVDLAGPSDFTSTASASSANIARTFIGMSSPTEASPINHVSRDDPPFLLIHGERDVTVPVSHSARFHEKLKSAGVYTEFIRVKNAGHGLIPVGGAAVDPPLDSIRSSILTFLQERLKK